jgi:integrase
LRKVRNATLDSRTARQKLETGKRHWMNLGAGLHLGYWRGATPVGKWLMRRYQGKGSQAYILETLASADDIDDADNAVTLCFDQAQARARHMHGEKSRVEAGFPAKAGAPFTVADCLTSYCDWLDAQRRSGRDARSRATSMIMPALGHIRCDRLTTAEIEKWLHGLAESAPRIRSAKGKVKHKAFDTDDPEVRRARQSNANRTLTILRAALNRAWRDGRIQTSNAAWGRVRPFRGADSARVRYLTADEARRLVRAAEPAFGRLVRAALATGCRYGELAALTVEDFHAESRTIHVRRSKAGKARHVMLGDEGVQLFEALTAGRPHDALIFVRADGSPWGRSAQTTPMMEACAAARIAPPTGFHGLRHTWASLAIMAGLPLMVAAKNLGHRDTRMCEAHYAHLSQSHVADAVRAHTPTFGFGPEKVVPARQRRA